MGVNQNTYKTHSKSGHSFSGDNLYISTNGWRCCRICNKNAQIKYRLTVDGANKVRIYRSEHRDQRRIASKNRRNAKRLYVSNVKNSPCVDCGISYPPYVMDLDHVRGNKNLDVSSLVDSNVSLGNIIQEIDKCDVVCSNCHRIRTYKRKNAL